MCDFCVRQPTTTRWDFFFSLDIARRLFLQGADMSKSKKTLWHDNLLEKSDSTMLKTNGQLRVITTITF